MDKLRKQRNLTKYTGDIVAESAVAECLTPRGYLGDPAKATAASGSILIEQQAAAFADAIAASVH